jgi:hypothetical protein
MKIKFEDVKHLYRDYVRSQIPATRLHCPSIESIYASLKDKKSHRTKNRIIDHISHCRLCLDEFDIIRSIVLQENKTLTDLIHIVPVSQKRDHSLSEEKDIYKIEKQKLSLKFPRLMAFSLGVLAAAFIIIGLFTNRQFIKEMLFPNQNRSPSQNEIVLLYPKNDMEYSRSNLQFRWKSIPKSDYYIIDIFDEALLPVWKSSPIFEPFFKFHVKLPELIKPKKKYFWMVTAIISNKNKLESDIGFFYFK